MGLVVRWRRSPNNDATRHDFDLSRYGYHGTRYYDGHTTNGAAWTSWFDKEGISGLRPPDVMPLAEDRGARQWRQLSATAVAMP